ncbi:MAG TPA: hypothetical protein VEI02_06090 [Planctomycetota bacterium]|nr:hypothetical protein [Planctomycetota bacterium]
MSPSAVLRARARLASLAIVLSAPVLAQAPLVVVPHSQVAAFDNPIHFHVAGDPALAGHLAAAFLSVNNTPSTVSGTAIGLPGGTVSLPFTPDALLSAQLSVGFYVDPSYTPGGPLPTTPTGPFSWRLANLMSTAGSADPSWLSIPFSWNGALAPYLGTLYLTAMTFDLTGGVVVLTGMSEAMPVRFVVPHGGQYWGPGDVVFPAPIVTATSTTPPPGPGFTSAAAGTSQWCPLFTTWCAPVQTNVSQTWGCLTGIGPGTSVGDEYWITWGDAMVACSASTGYVDFVFHMSCKHQIDVVLSDGDLWATNFQFFLLDPTFFQPLQQCADPVEGCGGSQGYWYPTVNPITGHGFLADACSTDVIGKMTAEKFACVTDNDCEDSCCLDGVVVRFDCTLLFNLVAALGISPDPTAPLLRIHAEPCF